MDISSASPTTPGGLLVLAGVLDTRTARTLRHQLSVLTSQSEARHVVDLTHVTSIDSTSLRVLLQATGRAREDGSDVHLVFDSRYLERVFRATALHKVFQVWPTVEDACVSLTTCPAGDLVG